MPVKTKQHYPILIALLDAVGIALVRTAYGLLDVLAVMASFLFDARTRKNKLYAVLLIGCTIPITLLDGDATATVFIAIIAIPMFFAKKNWIL